MAFTQISDDVVMADDGSLQQLSTGVIIDANGNVVDQSGTDVSGSVDAGSIVDFLARIGQAVTLTIAQKKLLDLNITRAQQGLPAISAQQAGVGVGVQVGLSDDTKRTLTYGAVALGAILLIGMVARR